MSKPLVQWSISPRRTAVIVVDMQKVFCEPTGALYVKNTADIVQPIQRLLEAARAGGLMVVYLRHIVRGDGSDTGRMRDLYPTWTRSSRGTARTLRLSKRSRLNRVM